MQRQIQPRIFFQRSMKRGGVARCRFGVIGAQKQHVARKHCGHNKVVVASARTLRSNICHEVTGSAKCSRDSRRRKEKGTVFANCLLPAQSSMRIKRRPLTCSKLATATSSPLKLKTLHIGQRRDVKECLQARSPPIT